MQVRFDDVTLAYAGSSPVLTGASFVLDAGWTGVVGANGAGKSTLLAALTGAPLVAAGTVQHDPSPWNVVALRQRVGSLPEEVAAFAWEWDADAVRLRSLLALGDDDVARWATLSPGERRRWQIAAALHARPHALLLDEPTNHVDDEARGAIVDALRGFDGVGVLVSHDRALLAELCTRTLRVAGGTARLFDQPYADARETWQLEEAQATVALERAQAAQRKERRALAVQRQALDAAERNRNSANRMKQLHDTDASSSAAKGRAEFGATAAARAAKRLTTRLDRAEQQTALLARPTCHAVALSLRSATASKRVLAELRDATLRAGEHVVATGVDLRLGRADRLWLRGPNGSGKSTLLRAVRAALTVPADEVLWLAQEEGDEAAAAGVARARATLEALPQQEQGEVLRVVGALGVDVPALLRSAQWSPGEARKVALALAARSPLSCVLLDEPTNHLDLPTCEQLELALASYEGALVVVTHDAAFGAALACEERTVGGVSGPPG